MDASEYKRSTLGTIIHSISLLAHLYPVLYQSGYAYFYWREYGTLPLTLVGQVLLGLWSVQTLFIWFILVLIRPVEKFKAVLWMIPVTIAMLTAFLLHLSHEKFDSIAIAFGAYHLITWALLVTRELGWTQGYLLPFYKDDIQIVKSYPKSRYGPVQTV